ncbi:MAG: hypothetical protein ACE5I1_20885, partial [bacterium]
AYPIIHFLDRTIFYAVIAGSIVGLLNIIIAYFFNKKAFLVVKDKLLKVFFSGIILRFLVIAVSFILIAKFSKLNLMAFAISVAVFYLLLQVYEVKYLNAQLARKKSYQNVV